jgi:hypothetical protein
VAEAGVTDDPTAPPLEVRRGVVLPQVRTAPGVELFSIGGGLNPSTAAPMDTPGEAAPAEAPEAGTEVGAEAGTGAVIPVSHLASGRALERQAPAGRSRARLVILGGVAAAVLVAVPLAVLSGGGHGRSPVRSAADGHGPNVTNPAAPAPSWPGGSQPPSPLPSDGVSGPPTTSKASPGGPGGKRAAGGGKADGGANHGTSPGRQASAQTSSARAIVSHASDRCISVSARKAKDGSPLQIWDCGGSAWQKWTVESDGTVRSMGMCMDVAWGSSDDGTAIQLARCHGGSAQHFDLNSAGDLVNLGSYKCVDVRDQDTANGTRLQLWECGGTSNQKWSAV